MLEDPEGVEREDTGDVSPSTGLAIARPATKIRRHPAQPVVAEIETVPMTAAQREDAIFALATLIERWEQAGSPTSRPDQTG